MTDIHSSYCSWLLAMGCCLLAFGCGQKQATTAPVSGNVTVGGKPVIAGRIAFYPENGRPAIASIGEDGTYRLTTFDDNDGAILGKHRVTIEAFEGSAAGPKPVTVEEELSGKSPRAMASGGPQLRWIVPEKYARRDTSPLTAEVVAGENSLKFDLP